MGRTATDITGEIRPESLYTLQRAKIVLGWGDVAMRTARRAGLPILYLGRGGFVRGQDIIDYVNGNAADAKNGVPKSTAVV